MITHEAPYYVARCLEVDVASQGDTPDEAAGNLVEAVALTGATEAPWAQSEPPRLTVIDVPAVGGPSVPAGDVERAALMSRLIENGWVVEEGSRHVVLRRHGHALVVPLATRIAPGVYRMIERRLASLEAQDRGARDRVDGPEPGDTFAALDALFAANPHPGDVTALVREQRDAL